MDSEEQEIDGIWLEPETTGLPFPIFVPRQNETNKDIGAHVICFPNIETDNTDSEEDDNE